MPSTGSGYAFEDFLQRLERSPVSHMSPLYHEHRTLFVHRPDMLSKAVLSISWERGLALLQAAYYSQPVASETYRSLLARMLRHNRHALKSAGVLVSWKAAVSVYEEAVLAHGTSMPTRLAVSTLRLVAPHQQWRAAINILKLNQANGQLTKVMLLDGADACATPAAWSHALRLLMHLHQQDPPLLTEAIQSMRPIGSTAVSLAQTTTSLLSPPRSDSSADDRIATHQHILGVLNRVVAQVPWHTAVQDQLCSSYTTHLLASTTLTPEVKVARLAEVLQGRPWDAALQLLNAFTEPSVLTDVEWATAQRSLPPSPPQHSTTRRRGKRKRSSGSATAKTEGQQDTCDALSSAGAEESAVLPSLPLLLDRLQLHQCSPSTIAAVMAVMAEKLPTPTAAAVFISGCHAHLAAQKELMKGDSGGVALGVAASTRHPVVRHALLRNCARHPDGWRVASEVLLEHSGAHVPTPTDVLSAVVLQLRQAKEVKACVRLLHDHIVPSGSKLTLPALEGVMECILAENRALHQVELQKASQLRAQKEKGDTDASTAHAHLSAPSYAASSVFHRTSFVSPASNTPCSTSSTLAVQTMQTREPLIRVGGVHWLSALSWALDLQTPPTESRIQKTGTGASAGATLRRPEAFVDAERPLSVKLLSLLLRICVDAGSPQGALHVLGYARRVNKTELRHAAEIRALLYCMMYHRPNEARVIVDRLIEKEGDIAAEPVRRLLELIKEHAKREETCTTL